MLNEIKVKRLSFVRCVTGDKNFKEGEYYASIGWNNGIGVQYEDRYGDCKTFIVHGGGVGAGDLNNPDNSGRPSFDFVDVRIFVEGNKNE